MADGGGSRRSKTRIVTGTSIDFPSAFTVTVAR